jgi:tetratricopeptide (TPR) repeat protein
MDYFGIGDKDSAQAEVAEVQRLVGSEPNSAFGYMALATALNAAGRPAEGLAASEKAIRLDPRNRDFYALTQGLSYSQLGRWQEAISTLEHVSEGPGGWPHIWRAVDYVELGRDDAARAEIAEVRKLNPQFSVKMAVGAFPADQERAAADLRKAGLN